MLYTLYYAYKYKFTKKRYTEYTNGWKQREYWVLDVYIHVGVIRDE